MIFAICSPYSLVVWESSLFSFGYELKQNQFADEQSSWLAYADLIEDRECVAVFGFAPLGLFSLWPRSPHAKTIALYLVLGVLSIGSATRSASRYLAPLMPAIFVLGA